MKKFLVMFLRRFFIGSAFGVFINQIIILLIAKTIGGGFMIDFNLLLKQFLASCIVGGVAVGFSVIYLYYFENINFFIKTLVHFSISVFTYLLVASYVGWFSINIRSILGSFLVYFGIWISFYLIEKKRIKKINIALKSKNR